MIVVVVLGVDDRETDTHGEAYRERGKERQTQ